MQTQFSPYSEQTASLPLIECGLTAIAVAVAFLWPRLAAGPLGRVERIFGRVARHPRLAVLTPGLMLLVLRIAILPIAPIPLPFIPDDFSFLLAAETFASGHLTNPTPPMWVHFESFHLDMHPTYMSMYFPGQGLLLALGKLLGHPWFAVLLCGALMCSAMCWMLRAWLPPGWAFLGAMLAVIRIGLFSYWVNTYTGGAEIAALGGALVLGALPRYTRSTPRRDGLLLAIGVVLLMTSRPYEGMLLCLPVGAYLAWWFFKSEAIERRVILQSAVIPMLLLVAAGSWMTYYNYRVFGSPLTLPYTINRATYATAPYYVWQGERPEPVYRHAVLADFYRHEEMQEFLRLHKPYGFFSQTLIKGVRALLFFAGFALAIPLIMMPRAMMDRRIRFLVLCTLVLAAGMAIEIFLIPHYLAPFTVVFYAIGLQCMRHLRVWQPEGRPVGVALVRASVVLCVGLAAMRLCTGPLHIVIRPWPASYWSGMWYGPEHFGVEREAIQERLEETPGKQLVIVRYSPDHYALNEWVYNAADIDRAKVVWAREMDEASNRELIQYYRGRRVWLAQPDLPAGEQLRPYANAESSEPTGSPRTLLTAQANVSSR